MAYNWRLIFSGLLFFQYGIILVCFYLACIAVVVSSNDNDYVLSDFKVVWLSHAPVSLVGNICRVS